jgi:hypothetical protein
MIKDRATLVEQVINAELDPRFYGPPQRPIVMIRHVIYDEWIIRSQLKWWLCVQTPWVQVACLKREPNILKGHPLDLKQVR